MPKSKQLPQWRNRIVGHGEEAPDQLFANPRNWRIHPKNQQDVLAGVLDQVGFVQSVIVNQRSGFVVDGHARVAMAISKQQATVPVVYVDIDDAEEALVLATLDPISAMAGRDEELLNSLIREIDIPQGALGDLLNELAGTKPKNLNDDDADLTPPTEPITKPGDLWLLGDHRLLCGDATKAEDVAWLMAGRKANLCITSPPYWIGREYEREHGRDEIARHIATASGAIAGAMADQAHIVINTGTTVETKQGGTVRRVWLLLDQWDAALAASGWCMRNVRIWRKEGGFSSFSPSQDVVGQDWEFLASFTRPKPRAQNSVGERWALDGVWDCQPQTRSVEHTAPFPVEIPGRYIALYSDSGDIVFEPYCGAGTTIVACEQAGRVARAIDIDAGSCDVAVRRWENLTGRKAVLDGKAVEVHA